MGTETMLELASSLASRMAAKAPAQLRVAFNEDDNSLAPQSECAHFLKLGGRRVGRDFELYDFMAKLSGGDCQPGIVMLLQEMVLPLQAEAPAAFQEGLAFMREQDFGDKQADWAELLDTLASQKKVQ